MTSPPSPAVPTIVLERFGPARPTEWVKTVSAVRFDVHCHASLVGHFLRLPQRGQEHQVLQVPPAAPAVYFCAVTRPYRWNQNDHVLALPEPGGQYEVLTPGYRVRLYGLRPVEITDEHVPADDPHRRDKSYVTCRNWQSAHLLHRVLGFPVGTGGTGQGSRRKYGVSDHPTSLQERLL